MATTTTEVVVTSAEGEEQRVEGGDASGSGSKPRRRFFKKKDPSEKQSRRPPDNKWLQQQIPACRPVFTAINAFVGFLIIGVAFIILGGVFTAFSSQLREFEVFYQDCPPIPTDDPSVLVHGTCEGYLSAMANLTNLERRGTPECHCRINFTLPEEMRGSSWNFYYGIRNYYQNHRRYLNSWDVNQLRGEVGSFRSPTSDCRPFTRLRPPDDPEADPLPVVPCGLVANSYFNDSFDSFTGVADGNNITVFLNRTNIAWETDRTIRFRNPGGGDTLDPVDLEGTIQPPSWLYNLSEIPLSLQNESLMVWFRVSAFPWFKKLYGRPAVGVNVVNESMTEMGASLPSGNYTIVLTYNYPVGAFGGRKSIYLAEVNWLGGRNLFLGIAYLVVGVFLIITAFALLIMHKICSNWKLNKAPFNTDGF